MASGLVFATVGTTKFDSLVFTLTQEDALKALRKRGYTKLRIQIGSGTILPNKENGKKMGISISHYRYKDSVEQDIVQADLVISHAGAGTCLEVLDKGKPLLVVINEELMHNHQTELADKLSSSGYLLACNTSTLCETIETMDLSVLKIFPRSESNLFPDFLNNFMGFRGRHKNEKKSH